MQMRAHSNIKHQKNVQLSKKDVQVNAFAIIEILNIVFKNAMQKIFTAKIDFILFLSWASIKINKIEISPNKNKLLIVVLMLYLLIKNSNIIDKTTGNILRNEENISLMPDCNVLIILNIFILPLNKRLKILTDDIIFCDENCKKTILKFKKCF